MSKLAPKMSKEVLERNRDVLKEAGAIVPLVPGEPTKADIKSHKEMENQFRGLLSLRGYVALTAHAVERAPPEFPGFYGGHGFRPTKQALRPDQVVYDRHSRIAPLRIEFKTLPLRWSPGQARLVEFGFWKLATSIEQAITLLDEWEAELLVAVALKDYV